MGTITYGDKVAINENTSVADINKVNASDMNEIKNAVNDNNSKAIGLQGTILWVNPNPTNPNTISVETNITLSSDDYDEIEWFWRLSTTNDFMLSSRHLKGYGTRFYYGSSYRPIKRNSDTSYTIGLDSNGDGQNGIPIYAVGYKTGVF